MRQRALALLFLLFLPLGGSAAAEEPAPRRPKIGLALGGGGARGAAHVGVLRVLERLNIPVDYVAGTSMGAIIGGLYASGLSVDQIEEELRSTNWSDLLADRPTYRDLVWRRKQDEGTYLLDLELGLRGAKLIVPTGLRAGQKLGFKLQTLLLPVGEVQDFSRLPIPFAAVATDVETGDRVILDHGDLAQSILASMTIPGVFSPAEIDGRLLVDGGMADNLPVEVVKAMGADIVIAVSVGTPLAGRDTLGSFLGVTGQAFGFLTVKNAERSAKLADVVIRPDLEGIDSGNFGLIGEAIPRGEAAAEGMRDKLQVYAIPAAEIVRPAPPPAPSGKLTGIEVAGNERVDARIIVARAGLQPGEELSIPRLRLALRRVFGLSEFQWARFELDPKDEGPAVLLRVKEKPWGPTYLHFGLEFVDDLEGEAEYALKLNLTRTMLNSRGAEWRNDLQVGSQPSLRSELYQPLDFKGRLFVAPWASVSHGRQPIFIDGRKTAYYAVDVDEVALDVGSEYGRFGEVRVGAYRSWIEADVETGAADLPSFDIDGGGVTVAATFETLDRPSIPRRGVSVGARCNFSRESLGATDSYDKLEFGTSYFFGRGRHTGFGVADYGSNLGSQLPIYDQFAVGGLFSLGGYSEGELSGQAVAGASLGYHYRLQTLPSGLGEGVYLGAILEARNAWESTKEISASDLRYGFTLLLGADTFLGPIFVGYGVAEAGRDRLYLTIGRSL